MRGAAILLVGASACVEHRVLEVSIDDYAFEYGFMVLRDGDGATTRISPPFGVTDGALTFGSLPAYDLEEQEQQIMLVGLPDGAVRELVPLFDLARAERLQLLELAPGALPFYESDGGDFLTVELPSNALVLSSNFDEPLADATDPGLPLRIPFAPEECKRMDPNGFVPFGIDSMIIPGSETEVEDNFFGASLIDENRALAATNKSLHLFRTGEPYAPVDVMVGSSGNRTGREVTMVNPYQLLSFAFDREESRVWLIASNMFSASLIELTVNGDSLTHVQTTPMVGKHNDVEVLPDHRPLVLSAGGEVKIFDQGTFTALAPLMLGEGEEAHQIHSTGDPETPWFASTTARLFVFRAPEGWRAFEPPEEWLQAIPVERGFRGNGLIHTRNPEGELELWAAGSSSVLLQKVGDAEWAKYELTFPPRFIGCSSGVTSYPYLSDGDGYDTIAADGDDLFVTIRMCSAALQIRRTSTCVALASIGDEAGLLLSSDLQAIDILGDTIILGGEDGLLYRGKLVGR